MAGTVKILIARDGRVAVDNDLPPQECGAFDDTIRAMLEAFGIGAEEIAEGRPRAPRVPNRAPERGKVGGGS